MLDRLLSLSRILLRAHRNFSTGSFTLTATCRNPTFSANAITSLGSLDGGPTSQFTTAVRKSGAALSGNSQHGTLPSIPRSMGPQPFLSTTISNDMSQRLSTHPLAPPRERQRSNERVVGHAKHKSADRQLLGSLLQKLRFGKYKRTDRRSIGRPLRKLQSRKCTSPDRHPFERPPQNLQFRRYRRSAHRRRSSFSESVYADSSQAHQVKSYATPKGHIFISLGSWSRNKGNLGKENESARTDQTLDDIDISWSKRFRQLEQERHINTVEVTSSMTLIRYCTSYNRRREAWEASSCITYEERVRLWQDTMLRCLRHKPRQALVILLDTFKSSSFRPPRNQVEDCLAFLARRYLFGSFKPSFSVLKSIFRLAWHFVGGGTSPDRDLYSIPQDAVYLILKNCDDARVLSFFKLLGAKRAALFPNTMFHFLDRFIEMGEFSLSIDLLATIARTGFDMSWRQIQSGCVKLLRAHWNGPRPYPIQLSVITRILELGIRPGTAMCNAILLTMIEGGDFETAWRTFEMAKETGLKFDSITYGVLAKGARLSESPHILKMIFHDVDQDPKMYQDLIFFSELLHTVGALSKGDAFPEMLELYKKHLDPRPLQELGLCGPETGAPLEAGAMGRWPPQYILGQMIISYNRMYESSDTLIARYNRYHDLVLQNHPLFAPIARNDYVANSFIMAFGRTRRLLPRCVTVVQHMLEPPSSNDQPPYAPPSVMTWSILARSYLSSNQKAAAEKVLLVMAARGLQPDRITWNGIISGYAGLQDVASAIDTVKRMEVAGWESTSDTFKALGKIRDRKALIDTMKQRLEEGDKANSMDE